LSWFSWTVGGFWPVAAIAGLIVGLPGGAMSYRSRLEQQAARRARILRLEVYSITVALSVLTRAGVGPFGALRQVAARANGVLAHDLRLGLSWMERGADGTEVLERLARESPEPAVGRLLRVLASSNATGRNPAGALRDLAEQLRRQRIEQLDQWSTKRRAAMLLPTVLLMFPVLLLYVLAPGALVLLGL
ncbi:MAG: type II secretion system F family protein, partial [Actinomycetota bacterium]